MTPTEAKRLMELAGKAKEQLDCGDSGCHFKNNIGGMRTNGGCRCLRNVMSLGPYPRVYFQEASPDTIKKLCESYLKAVEVIKFYARETSWDDRILRIGDDEPTVNHAACGGKRARDFLKGIGDE